MTDFPEGLFAEPDLVVTDQRQAALLTSRQRRRSLAGVPDLHRTHFLGSIPTTSIPAASFPSRSKLVTFWTAVRITENAGQHRGLIFELGDSTTGIAAWIDDDQIGFRAGDSGVDDRAFATWTTGTGELPVGLEVDLVFGIQPGTGRVRIWGNGGEIARAEATNGAFASGWAAASDGSFATAVNGTTPADVPQTGAPAGFEVIQALSVYVGVVPRHFV